MSLWDRKLRQFVDVKDSNYSETIVLNGLKGQTRYLKLGAEHDTSWVKTKITKNSSSRTMQHAPDIGTMGHGRGIGTMGHGRGIGTMKYGRGIGAMGHDRGIGKSRFDDIQIYRTSELMKILGLQTFKNRIWKDYFPIKKNKVIEKPTDEQKNYWCFFIDAFNVRLQNTQHISEINKLIRNLGQTSKDTPLDHFKQYLQKTAKIARRSKGTLYLLKKHGLNYMSSNEGKSRFQAVKINNNGTYKTTDAPNLHKYATYAKQKSKLRNNIAEKKAESFAKRMLLEDPVQLNKIIANAYLNGDNVYFINQSTEPRLYLKNTINGMIGSKSKIYLSKKGLKDPLTRKSGEIKKVQTVLTKNQLNRLNTKLKEKGFEKTKKILKSNKV